MTRTMQFIRNSMAMGAVQGFYKGLCEKHEPKVEKALDQAFAEWLKECSMHLDYSSAMISIYHMSRNSNPLQYNWVLLEEKIHSHLKPLLSNG